jgi:hypothetical protein
MRVCVCVRVCVCTCVFVSTCVEVCRARGVYGSVSASLQAVLSSDLAGLL